MTDSTEAATLAMEFADLAAAVEREEVKRRLQLALSAHQRLHSPHSIQQHDGLRKAYLDACAQLIPLRHLLFQVAA